MVCLVSLLSLLVAPTPAELVNAYQDWTRSFDKAEYRLQIRETYRGPKPVNGMTLREGRHLVRRDGERWKIEYEGTNRHPADRRGNIETVAEAFEFSIAKPPTFVEVGREGDALQVQYVIAYLAGLPADRPFAVGRCDFMALYGYINGNGTKSIQDILTDSALSVAADALNGAPGWRLDGVGEYGQLHIWFDSQPNPRVRRLLLTKTGSNLLGNIPVNKIPQDRPDDLYFPASCLAKVATSLDFARFGDLSDPRVPAEASLTTTWDYTDDARVEVRYEMHIDEFHRETKFATDAFDVTAPIPEGFVVQVEDQPNIDYEWRNGKITKKVNHGTLANLMASVFETAFSGVGYFVVFAALVLGIAAAGTWAYRRRRA